MKRIRRVWHRRANLLRRDSQSVLLWLLPALSCSRLCNKPSSKCQRLAIAGQHRDNAPARWLTTLSMGALLVLPQRYSVHQVRSGRKQPGQTTCVPGCSWQGPHPFLLSSDFIEPFSFPKPCACCLIPQELKVFNSICNISFIQLKYYCHKHVIIDCHFIFGCLFSVISKKYKSGLHC